MSIGKSLSLRRTMRNDLSDITDLDAVRKIPFDTLMLDLEHDYRAGRIGITPDGAVIRLANIYRDLRRSKPGATYNIMSPRDIDRELQRQCNHEPTAYRTTELKETEQDRCPFCHKRQPPASASPA